jgi:hypothetical protein
MIKYSQVADLPADHPLYKQFIKEQEELDTCYVSCNQEEDEQDEDCIDYFNRYMKGDR